MADTDGDGLEDGEETNTLLYVDPSDTGTDPNDVDTDGDGLEDGAERLDGVAFVTSSATTPDFGGVAGGDALCQGAADAAGLGSGFSAWLSTSAVDARDRIGDVPYSGVDGALLATGIADLTDGLLDSSLNLDENGAVVAGTIVWTGTVSDGTHNTVDGSCDDWSSTAAPSGGVGLLGPVTGGLWTQLSPPAGCNAALRLYCFAPARGLASNPTLADSDGDGLTDDVETGTGVFVDANDTGTNALVPDSDGDGLFDAFEVANNFDPNVDAGEANADGDGDGLDNLGEQTAGTNPGVPDTDGDGADDGDEVPGRNRPPRRVPAARRPDARRGRGSRECPRYDGLRRGRGRLRPRPFRDHEPPIRGLPERGGRR